MNELERLKQQYQRGDISRRRFLQQVAAIGGVAALHAAGMPGVIGDVRAAAPKSGGHVRFGMGSGSTTDSLDPGTINSTFMQIVNYGARNCLTEVAPSGDIAAELCEGWEASPDAKTWTFELRKGVEFHNGKTLDADDVIASIQHHRKEDSGSAAKSILKPIKDIRADGKNTVVFEMHSGNADFPYLLSDYHLVIMPVTKNGLEVTSGVGTGGYVLENFEPGIRCAVQRNPDYWKENAAWFESGEIIAMRDSASRTNALTTKEIDVMNRVQLNTVNLLRRRPGIRLEETSGNQHASFPMHTNRAPFSDNDVRLALKYGIDRNDVLDKILQGHGYVGNDHPLGRANSFLAENLEQRQYDPERAKSHLKKAGKEGLRVDLHVSDAAFQGAVDTAVLFKEHAAKAGLEINVVRVPSDGYWSDIWLKKPFCASYWGGRPTADQMFSVAYAAGADWNASYWDHARFNELLVKARAELDREKRQEMYTEMQRICRDEGGVIIPVFLNYVMAMQEKVQHGKMANDYDLDGLRALERWWFA